jgi:hypothetical protein
MSRSDDVKSHTCEPVASRGAGKGGAAHFRDIQIAGDIHEIVNVPDNPITPLSPMLFVLLRRTCVPLSS